MRLFTLVLLALASSHLAQAAEAVEEVATLVREFHPLGSPPVRENPVLKNSYYKVPECAAMRARGSFAISVFEEEAIARQMRTGPESLDIDDKRWVSNVVNRERECIDLLRRQGQ
mgnify:CR=1 FL=1